MDRSGVPLILRRHATVPLPLSTMLVTFVVGNAYPLLLLLLKAETAFSAQLADP
jgi:hypothetical protein